MVPPACQRRRALYPYSRFRGYARAISNHPLLLDYKHRIRNAFRFYSQDLINNLFVHPYTKIEFVERDLKVSRITATKYLDALDAAGFVRKVKVGRSNYYINIALHEILTRDQV